MTKTIEIIVDGSLLFLTPEEILVDDDILKARPLYDLEHEQVEIEELAHSMEQNTQIEPVVVRPAFNGDEESGWHLIAGRRRRDAAMLVNAKRHSKEEPYRLSAIVKQGVDRDRAFQMALSENLKRKNLNPIQNALVIKELRTRFGWDGAKGSKRVAEFLQVSPAFVTTHEKLLTLDEGLQARVAKGELSAQAAFEFLNTKPELREAVESTAKSLQEAEGANREHQDGSGDGQKIKNVMTGRPGKKKALKARHIRTASRQHAASIQLKPLNRAEIIDFWVKVQSPAYGWPNGAIHTFAKTFIMWTEGKITDQTLKKHFDAMVEKSYRGKAEKPVKEEKTGKKTRKKK